MAGGVMQLVAYGVQDVYLTGNPQITYWKVIYKRHTNFACEPIEQSFSGTADFGKTSVTATVARNGDLMSRVYLKCRVQLSSKPGSEGKKFAWVRRLGHAMIREVSCQIGGATIDRQTGDWMNVWHELARDANLDAGYAEMIGDTPHMTEMSADQKEATLYVPLTFWFCRNPGLALPLIALQYHEVNFKFNFNSVDKLVVKEDGCEVSGSIVDASLLIDYVFLDSEERKRFAQSAHEYLIEQLQTPDEDTINEQNKKFRLSFNHPCKEVVWAQKMGKFNNASNNTFAAYHPTDAEWVKRRVAETIYLLALKVTGTAGDLSVTATGTTYDIRDNMGKVQEVVEALQDGVVVVTRKADDMTSFDQTQLPAEFGTDPFAYVEFLDESWRHVPNWVVSTPIEQWGLPAEVTDSAQNPLWESVSSHFVRVNMPCNYGVWMDGSSNPTMEANIQLNGQDRFSKRDGHYFNYVQPWQHHSNTPCDGVNVYSFALEPEKHQPSGTCNFSRIDYAQLSLKLTNEAKNSLGQDSTITIFTTNYNVLRIMSGINHLSQKVSHSIRFLLTNIDKGSKVEHAMNQIPIACI